MRRYRLVLIFGLAAIFGPAEAGTRDRMIETAPGIHIHVLDAAPRHADDAALVLVPGWRLTAEIWREQIDHFGGTRRVIAIDPRSQGGSTKTAEGDTPEQRARDLSALLARLQPGRVVLVGWSQGVQDVAAYVDQFGTASLDGIVLVDSTISPGAAAIAQDSSVAVRQLGLLSLYAEAPEDYTRGMMAAIITRKLPADQMDKLVHAALQTPTAIGAAMLTADLFGKDRSAAIAKFDRPTLVIASAASSELAAQQEMAGKLPKGRIAVVENAGHAVFIDQPAKFDALLDDFLKGLA